MQVHVKQLMIRVLLIAAIIFSIYVCIFGRYGLLTLFDLKQKNIKMMALVNMHQKELGQLKQDIELWNTSSFLKEKKAREALHMARKDDIVYYVQKQ